jgi:ABC-2 type transport system ATP-binding protein
MPDLALETHGLRKEFGPKVAVAELSLAVRVGEVFGFLGPNGAGKTTSLKMLLGLTRPTAGTGTLLGAPIGDRRARARVGFLPEHFRFHDWLEGRELLRFHGRLLGLDGLGLDARIESLLERVDLLDAIDRPLHGYSKGMLQRIGLAQAMLNDPELVFLDEPTSGLDPLGRLLVRDIIGELRARGTTVFLNSHLLGEVEVTCDRVAFIRQGRTVRELTLGAPSREIEVALRFEPMSPGLRAGAAGFGRELELRDGTLVLAVAGEQQLPELARWLVANGARLFGMHVRPRSLERVFLEVMGGEERPG